MTPPLLWKIIFSQQFSGAGEVEDAGLGVVKSGVVVVVIKELVVVLPVVIVLLPGVGEGDWVVVISFCPVHPWQMATTGSSLLYASGSKYERSFS